MVATSIIGAWVIDRHARAAELALSEDTAVGVVLEIVRGLAQDRFTDNLARAGRGSAAYSSDEL